MSQSVEPNHPCGLEFLYRDCTNVADFFRQRGLKGGKSPWRLFTDITELPLQGDDHECPQSEAEILARIMVKEFRDTIRERDQCFSFWTQQLENLANTNTVNDYLDGD